MHAAAVEAVDDNESGDALVGQPSDILMWKRLSVPKPQLNVHSLPTASYMMIDDVVSAVHTLLADGLVLQRCM
jgi:hypothetical protein